MQNRTQQYNRDISELYLDQIFVHKSYSEIKSEIYQAKKYGVFFPLQKYLQSYVQEYIQADYIVFPGRTAFQQIKSWNPNLAKICALKYAKHTKIPIISQFKKRLSFYSQKTSSRKERQKNIQSSFLFDAKKLRKQIHNKDILLIDDIISSGSTANEIAKICKNHGAKTVTGYFYLVLQYSLILQYTGVYFRINYTLLMSEHITLLGVHTHNLKNIDVQFPKNKLSVVTGVSGSGKSSLAFQTLCNE